jgi:hypothetical protein
VKRPIQKRLDAWLAGHAVIARRPLWLRDLDCPATAVRRELMYTQEHSRWNADWLLYFERFFPVAESPGSCVARETCP